MNNLLDKIIEDEFKKFIESLKNYIIGNLEDNYKIKFIEPKLKIVEGKPSITGEYLPSENEIIISKKSIESLTNSQLKFLGYNKIKRSNSNIQHIVYLNIPYKSYDSTLVYSLHINGKDIRTAIEEFFIDLAMYHEGGHLIDYMILHKLSEDSTIKDRDYLLTILNNHDNLELRASAFEVIMNHLNDPYNDKKGYITVYFNIPTCINYIKEINELEKNKYKKKYVPYDLGICYGNIIVAKYKSSLEENIDKIIDYIIHLDKKRAIDAIKYYGDNLNNLLHD